ncbi:uncharacterized protein LOC143299086 [Babylonia areolata]|uniref:uncharacterized protein LOC143299086 n=1 Tax=Babylonia areolata TaxID=304850 RepID=UPI003FCF36CE
MATQLLTKVVVKNLPAHWTVDHLQNFLEVVTSLTVADNGVHKFRGIRHTALLTLEEAVTEESLYQDKQSLTQTPFDGVTLQLEAVTGWTCSVLVTYTDPTLTRDHIFFFFDNPDRSGCGDAEVTDCEIYPEVSVAVVHFTLPEGVTGVIAKGNHILKQGGETVRVEPWYEQFHRPLLQHLTSGARPKVKPPVPPKPKVTEQYSSCSPPKVPKPSQDSFEVERLRREMEILRQENIQLKITEAEKRRMETEQLKSENEKLKKQAAVRLDVPGHKLRLLADFSSEPREGCQVTLLEQEEVALFHGIEEKCQAAQLEFLMRMQKLTEEVILLSDPVSRILETSRGKVYVEDMVQRFPGCAAKVQNFQLLCAAFCDLTLQPFKTEFERNVLCRTCKVPPSLAKTTEFQALKTRLENEFMVMVTLPTGNCDDVKLEGINGDVELAAREVDEFTKLNRADSKEFHIPGKLQGKACKLWYSSQLDEAKQLILKNGEIKGESVEDGYTLTFQCRQETLPFVLSGLTAIKEGIGLVRVDLNKEFPKYAEQALIINGLHSYGVPSFCSHLGGKLKEWGIESISDIRLPDICSLPQPRLKTGRGDSGHSGRRESHKGRSHHSESRGGSGHPGRHHRSSGRRKNYPPLPCSMTVGGATITIKSGDITAEQVGAAMCLVGQDLGLKGTAIGLTFLKKCPALAQTLQTNAATGGDSRECRLVTTPTTGSSLPMPFLFHAVLKKLPRPGVKKVVKELVLQSLQLTAQNGQTSIALPPIGVGRRFDFGEYTTASTMAFAFKEYLQQNPSTIQNISVVVYDVSLAGKFAQIISQKLGAATPPQVPPAPPAAAATTPAPPPPPPADADDNSSDTDDGDDDSENNVMLEAQEAVESSQSGRGLFEAQICVDQPEDRDTLRQVLLGELKTIFLWHETLRKNDLDKFYDLGLHVIQDILITASKTNVHLSLCDKGLRMCGQKHLVHQLLAGIKDQMLLHIEQQSSQAWSKRAQLRLPVETDRLPSYWKVCRKDKDHKVSYDKALEAWHKRGTKPNNVTAEERTEVDKLIQATWEADKAGAGKDARNLTHTQVQVVRVERLENPQLWQEYSHRRELLFRRLEHRASSASSAFFTPLEQLSGSRGVLKTTENIAARSLLDREIYHQINEHYLFHGTKKSILSKIFEQGLDFRMAGDKTMLGSGVYAAESSTKADQYTDFKQDRTTGEELKMILMRVLLGEPFIHKHEKPQQFKRPPCMSCSQKRCDCQGSHLFNSVIDDATRIFREFVVYDQNVCYPEYIITYKRI